MAAGEYEVSPGPAEDQEPEAQRRQVSPRVLWFLEIRTLVVVDFIVAVVAVVVAVVVFFVPVVALTPAVSVVIGDNPHALAFMFHFWKPRDRDSLIDMPRFSLFVSPWSFSLGTVAASYRIVYLDLLVWYNAPPFAVFDPRAYGQLDPREDKHSCSFPTFRMCQCRLG